jgi:hypothetical protein
LVHPPSLCEGFLVGVGVSVGGSGVSVGGSGVSVGGSGVSVGFGLGVGAEVGLGGAATTAISDMARLICMSDASIHPVWPSGAVT